MPNSIATDASHSSRILDVVHSRLSGSALSAHNTSEVVARSWSRCLNDYHLDPRHGSCPPVLSGRERERRLVVSAGVGVIDCARLEMTTLHQQLADPDCAGVLAGIDGVIMHMVSTPEFAREVAPMGFCVGGIWSEEEAGTNGMGTCVAAGAPVAVRQAEHLFPNYASLTCSAVPIFDPNGNVVAVLDVTSRSPLLQQHSLILLGMTAQQIENRVLDRCFRDAYPLRFHSRPKFVYTLHEGRLRAGSHLPDHARRHRQAQHAKLLPSGRHLPGACGESILRGGAATCRCRRPAGQQLTRYCATAAPTRQQRESPCGCHRRSRHLHS